MTKYIDADKFLKSFDEIMAATYRDIECGCSAKDVADMIKAQVKLLCFLAQMEQGADD